MINSTARFNTDLAECHWAAISFVPDDLAWFDWIIRQLEGYPVPSGLAGAATRHGFSRPEKLTLFPDRWNPLNFEAYPEALETSRFLVVIVSENSAHATWVEDQIADFKRAGGEERIIALVVDGKPDAPGPPNGAAWLPKWLAWRLGPKGFADADAQEPVVIDVRAGGPGLEPAREALLAALLNTTCQELERMGGLTPPLDLTRSSGPLLEDLPKIEIQPIAPAKTDRVRVPKIKPAILSAAASVAVVIFGAGWFAGRITSPAPAPVVVARPAAGERKVPTPPPIEVAPPVVAEAIAPPPAAAPPNEPPAPSPVPAEPAPSAPAVAAVSTGPTSAELGAQAQAEREKAPLEQAHQQENALRAEWLGQVAAGDTALQKGKTLQAVDFYNAALATAERYTARRVDDVAALAEIALLCRKVGALQLQVASVAEARASYERGRRLLLVLKARGPLAAASAQCLQDLETGLTTLPRN
jgi:hypothetical protein